MIKLVAGLGNDDEKYRLTAHNIGFWCVDVMAARLGTDARSDGRFYLFKPAGRDFMMLKPRSYMNVCGPAVREAMDYFKVKPAELLVVYDDFELPLGRLRLRRDGSSGGHNGMKSVIESVGGMDFPRLRIGVGPVPPRMDPADFVLRKQKAADLKVLAEKAADALEVALADGIETAMNRFNKADTSQPPDSTEKH